MEKKIKPKKVSEDTQKEDIVSKPGFRKYSQKIKDQVITWHKEGKKPEQIVIDLGGKGPKIKAVKRWIHKHELRY